MEYPIRILEDIITNDTEEGVRKEVQRSLVLLEEVGDVIMIRNKKYLFFSVFIMVIILIVAAIVPFYLYSRVHKTASSVEIVINERDKGWIEDLNVVKTELPKKHINLFFSKSETEFNSDMDMLISKVNQYSDMEIKAELIKIINSIKDSHTTVSMQGMWYYPLGFFEFEEDIYLTDCPLEYKEMWGKKLIGINGYSIEELRSMLKPYVSQDNLAIAKNSFANRLISKEYLQFAGILKGDEVVYSFEDSLEKNISLKPLSYEEFQKVKFVSQQEAFTSIIPLAKQKSKTNYWFKYLEDYNVMYAKYNACSNMSEYPFSKFAEDVFQTIDSKNVKTLIIDLRDNGGGSSAIFDSFLTKIKERENINKKGNLFVIVGRKTFSSAILNAMELKNKTNAILIGEPTGGKPNHFGEVKFFHLDNSNMNINYSSKQFKTSNLDLDSLYPDIDISLRAFTYFNGKDDFLEYILNSITKDNKATETNKENKTTDTNKDNNITETNLE